MAEYGTFSGNPKTEWMTDANGKDRGMKLLEEFRYTDPDGKVWVAPKDEVINGADIPRALWSSLGSPFVDDYRRASIVHDVACRTPNVTRKQADDMFYTACLAGGCNQKQANLLYAGIRIGGKFLQVSSLFGDSQNIDYTPGASGWPSDAAEAFEIYKEAAGNILSGKTNIFSGLKSLMGSLLQDEDEE